jgi:hypothetical protein
LQVLPLLQELLLINLGRIYNLIMFKTSVIARQMLLAPWFFPKGPTSQLIMQSSRSFAVRGKTKTQEDV